MCVTQELRPVYEVQKFFCLEFAQEFTAAGTRRAGSAVAGLVSPESWCCDVSQEIVFPFLCSIIFPFLSSIVHVAVNAGNTARLP